MVPMADNLNHSSVDVTNEIINVTLHKQGENNPEYYRISKFLNDYSGVWERGEFTDEEKKKYELNFKGRFNRKLFEMNQEALSVLNLRLNLQQRNRHIWEVPYNHDAFEEDNDTDEESDEDDESRDKVVVVEGKKKR